MGGPETKAGLVAFAKSRGLKFEADGEVRELTPGLITGPSGGVPALASGRLGEGLDGTLCHHVYADDRRRRNSTVVLARVPESAAFVPALVCRDRELLGDRRPPELPMERWQAVALESIGFNRRYSLMVIAGQDPGLMRELFSPKFIAWLESAPPAGFSFELNEGHLAITLPDHLAEAAVLERLCALAGQLGERLRAEIAEESGPGLDLYDESEEHLAIEKALGAVTWEEPPESARAAIERYRQAAARKPVVLVGSLIWAGIAAATLGGGAGLIATAIGGPIPGVLTAVTVAVVVAAAVFTLAQLLRSSRYRWGRVSISRVGLEAFMREYARSRGLELEDRWRFHAEHRHVPLPGIPEHVLRGALPGTGLRGWLVMLGDVAELRARGEELAYAADRPHASTALLVRTDRDLSGALSRIELPPDYGIELTDREILVWRPVPGSLIRTAEGTDAFCARAGGVVSQLLGQSTPTLG